MVREIISSHFADLVRTLNPLIIPSIKLMDQGFKMIGLNTLVKEFRVLISFSKRSNSQFLSQEYFLLAEKIFIILFVLVQKNININLRAIIVKQG